MNSASLVDGSGGSYAVRNGGGRFGAVSGNALVVFSWFYIAAVVMVVLVVAGIEKSSAKWMLFHDNASDEFDPRFREVPIRACFSVELLLYTVCVYVCVPYKAEGVVLGRW